MGRGCMLGFRGIVGGGLRGLVGKLEFGGVLGIGLCCLGWWVGVWHVVVQTQSRRGIPWSIRFHIRFVEDDSACISEQVSTQSLRQKHNSQSFDCTILRSSGFTHEAWRAMMKLQLTI